MTVIAWDGKSLAADRLSQNGGLRRPVTKLHLVSTPTAGQADELWALAFTGVLEEGMVLLDWFRDGAEPAKWPEFQRRGDDWTRLVIANRTGCFTYDREPKRIEIPGPFMAFGSGVEFALGAMSAGADAKRAVEIACEHSIYCGMGVDVVELP